MSNAASSATADLPPPPRSARAGARQAHTGRTRPGRAQTERARPERAGRPVGVTRLLERLGEFGFALRRRVIDLTRWRDGEDGVEPPAAAPARPDMERTDASGPGARVLGFDVEAVHRALSHVSHRLIALLARIELRAKPKPRAPRSPSPAALAKRAEAAALWAERIAEFNASGLDKRYRPLKREWGVPPDRRPGRRARNRMRRMELAMTIIDLSDDEVVEEACRELTAVALLTGEVGRVAAIEALGREIIAALAAEARANEAPAGSPTGAARDAGPPPDGPSCADMATPWPAGAPAPQPPWRPPDSG